MTQWLQRPFELPETHIVVSWKVMSSTAIADVSSVETPRNEIEKLSQKNRKERICFNVHRTRLTGSAFSVETADSSVQDS